MMKTMVNGEITMTSSCGLTKSGNINGYNGHHVPDKVIFEDNSEVPSSHTRDDMKAFWEEHSHEASEQEMMLDSKAEELGKLEVPEILSSIPNVSGSDVLELGAGIGRFTGHLADAGAASVTAVDFMESFVKKNIELNGHRKNVKFMQADVTQLVLDQHSYDLVFSNWLLMYLGEAEVFQLFRRVLQWLRPGGHFFFRESCFHPSGDASRKQNPTKYRSPAVYDNLLKSVTCKDEEGKVHRFDVLKTKPVQTYIKLKSNHNQICWLVRKTHLSGPTACENGISNGHSPNGL